MIRVIGGFGFLVSSALAAQISDAWTVNSPRDGYLALRSEPSVTNGIHLAEIPHGATLTINGCTAEIKVEGVPGHWCRTTYQEGSGWVFDAFLIPPSPGSGGDPDGEDACEGLYNGKYVQAPTENLAADVVGQPFEQAIVVSVSSRFGKASVRSVFDSKSVVDVPCKLLQ